MLPADRDALISSLLLSPRMQRLWDVGDRGMPVYAHTIDVALLCLDRLSADRELDLSVVLLGALVHDVSKLPLDQLGGRSHSLLMRSDPEPAADVSMDALADAEARCGVAIDDQRRAHVRHVVLSHHGGYGKVQPRTPEARLVAACDFVSSTQHRLAPVDANDVLPLLSEGYRWKEAAALLGVGRELIKTRLRESCQAEGVRDWVQLLPIWRRAGRVASGPFERERQMARAKLVNRVAREVPGCILDRLARPAAPLVATGAER